MGLAGIAGTVAVTAPVASAAPAAGAKVRICNHASNYNADITFNTNKHTLSIAPGHCSHWRPSLMVGKIVYVQGRVKKWDVWTLGSYKVPHGTYEVDVHGARKTATFSIVRK